MTSRIFGIFLAMLVILFAGTFCYLAGTANRGGSSLTLVEAEVGVFIRHAEERLGRIEKQIASVEDQVGAVFHFLTAATKRIENRLGDGQLEVLPVAPKTEPFKPAPTKKPPLRPFNCKREKLK